MIKTAFSPSQLTSSAARRKKFTADDYRATPEEPPWMQLIDGKFYVSESPTPLHQQIVLNLCLILGRWAKSSRAGRVHIAPLDVYLSQYDVVQPDVFFVANHGLSLPFHGRLKGAPDLVVEILSRSTARLDRFAKRNLYATTGVREMWIVEPNLRQVEIYRFAEDRLNPIQTVRDGDELVSPVLPGLIVEISEVFQE